MLSHTPAQCGQRGATLHLVSRKGKSRLSAPFGSSRSRTTPQRRSQVFLGLVSIDCRDESFLVAQPLFVHCLFAPELKRE